MSGPWRELWNVDGAKLTPHETARLMAAEIERLRAELARRDEQIAAVRALEGRELFPADRLEGVTWVRTRDVRALLGGNW